MNGSQALRALRDALVAAGAVPVRTKGGHQIWRLPSGRTYPISLSGKTWTANPRKMKNTLADIRRIARGTGARGDEGGEA